MLDHVAKLCRTWKKHAIITSITSLRTCPILHCTTPANVLCTTLPNVHLSGLFCSEREAKRSDARRRESESESQLREMHNLNNQLSNRNQPIQEFTSQNKAAALQRLTADLDACKKRQDKLEAEVQVRFTHFWSQHNKSFPVLLKGVWQC